MLRDATFVAVPVMNLILLSMLTTGIVDTKELLYLHRGALALIFGTFGADVLL